MVLPCGLTFDCHLLAGDHLYRMNYQDFVTTHRKTGADITVAALPTDEKQATAFGLMKIDGSGRIQVTLTPPLLLPSRLCMSTAGSPLEAEL